MASTMCQGVTSVSAPKVSGMTQLYDKWVSLTAPASSSTANKPISSQQQPALLPPQPANKSKGFRRRTAFQLLASQNFDSFRSYMQAYPIVRD
jgi:hypothetical protein